MKRLLVTIALSVATPLCFVSILCFVIRHNDVTDMYEYARIWGVVAALPANLAQSVFTDALAHTLYVVLKGSLIGIFMAWVVGVVIGVWPALARYVAVCLNAMRAVPLTMLTPFLIAAPALFVAPPWLGTGTYSRDPALLVALGVFLYVFIGFTDGVARRDMDRYRILSDHHGISGVRYFGMALLHEVMPELLTSVRLAALFALVLAVVLDLPCNYPGVGMFITERVSDASGDRESQALGMMLMTSYLGVGIDSILVAVSAYVLRWRNHRL